ncbi:hypothetical protein [Streptomyces bicolor]|uniref:hypothetical protein n=1 Tax=Streptomyces bicolor TaxID=66874 RepID=UPI001428B05A|nr:hypothetical protein [Streptomyces bicolor]
MTCSSVWARLCPRHECGGTMMRAIIDARAAGRLGTPAGIASADAFLLGPDSGFVSGADLLLCRADVEDRTLLVAGGDGLGIAVWDPVTGERVGDLGTDLAGRMSGHGWVRAVCQVRPSGDPPLIVTAGYDDGARVWDVRKEIGARAEARPAAPAKQSCGPRCPRPARAGNDLCPRGDLNPHAR